MKKIMPYKSIVNELIMLCVVKEIKETLCKRKINVTENIKKVTKNAYLKITIKNEELKLDMSM